MLVFATVNCFHIICRIHTKYLLHLINDPPTHKYLTNEIPIIIGFLIVCAQNVSTEMSEVKIKEGLLICFKEIGFWFYKSCNFAIIGNHWLL